MKKRFLSVMLGLLFLILTISGNSWSEEVLVSDYDVLDASIMRPDMETRLKWIKDYESAPRAPIDNNIKLMLTEAQDINVGTSLSLLNYLQYTPVQRNQGSCGNCWVWAGTGIMEIALNVQNGIKDRFSIQFLNSCKSGSYACCGGYLTDVSSFYSGKGYSIPWSNTNAFYQDGSRTCVSGSSAVSCGSISTSPNYPITSITAQTISTIGVGQSSAIANIKNILNQNKAVWFAYWLARGSDWTAFFNFWLYQNETAIWDPDPYCGATWDSGGGGHAVLIVGYNDDDLNPANHYWLVLNSWGTAGGNRPNGLFRMKMYMNYDCSYYYPGYGWYYDRNFQTLNVQFSPLMDFGDAPDPTYPSLRASNGARHTGPPDFYFGMNVDYEADSRQVNADLYDDGLVSRSPITFSVTNPSSTVRYVNILIDWNQDGDWNDPGEWAVQNFTVAVSGNYTPNPVLSLPNYTWMRLTITGIQLTNYNGSWPSVFNLGETEDYIFKHKANKHAYHFWIHQQYTEVANDAMVWATAWKWPGGGWGAPGIQHVWSSCFFPNWNTWTQGIWRGVRFWGNDIPYCTWCWFNVDFYWKPCTKNISTAFFRWTKDGNYVGPWIWLGWRFSSPPALYNPEEFPDGNQNTDDMIVRYVQFANSPTRIPNDETTLDNPKVQHLFETSLDPLREGPFIVPPSHLHEFEVDQNVVLEPEIEGRTVLVKGEIWVGDAGEWMPFVVQFIAESKSKVTLLVPNGGEIWKSAAAGGYPITWLTSGTIGPVATTKLFYTMDGGTTWKLIATLSGNPGSYTWYIPKVSVTKNKCKVKVVLKNTANTTIGSDMSDKFFKITP